MLQLESSLRLNLKNMCEKYSFLCWVICTRTVGSLQWNDERITKQVRFPYAVNYVQQTASLYREITMLS